jgi:hypothetical protein
MAFTDTGHASVCAAMPGALPPDFAQLPQSAATGDQWPTAHGRSRSRVVLRSCHSRWCAQAGRERVESVLAELEMVGPGPASCWRLVRRGGD